MSKTVSFALKIPGDTVSKLKEFCNSHGIKIGFFIQKAVLEKIEREEMVDDTRDIINLRHEETAAIEIGDYFAKRNL